jgi:hypothetical protein
MKTKSFFFQGKTEKILPSSAQKIKDVKLLPLLGKIGVIGKREMWKRFFFFLITKSAL